MKHNRQSNANIIVNVVQLLVIIIESGIEKKLSFDIDNQPSSSSIPARWYKIFKKDNIFENLLQLFTISHWPEKFSFLTIICKSLKIAMDENENNFIPMICVAPLKSILTMLSEYNIHFKNLINEI